mgnify:CR=1 FL=1
MAAFWSALLGVAVVEIGEDYVELAKLAEGAPNLLFLQVPEAKAGEIVARHAPDVAHDQGPGARVGLVGPERLDVHRGVRREVHRVDANENGNYVVRRGGTNCTDGTNVVYLDAACTMAISEACGPWRTNRP